MIDCRYEPISPGDMVGEIWFNRKGGENEFSQTRSTRETINLPVRSHWIDKVNALFCEISELSIIFLCTNHVSIRVVGFILRKGFGVLGTETQVIHYLAQFVFAMALMLFAGSIIDRTNLRVVLGRKRLNE